MTRPARLTLAFSLRVLCVQKQAQPHYKEGWLIHRDVLEWNPWLLPATALRPLRLRVGQDVHRRGRYLYFSNHAKTWATLAMSRLGRAVME